MILITHKLKGSRLCARLFALSLSFLPLFLILSFFSDIMFFYYCLPSPFLPFQSIDRPYFDIESIRMKLFTCPAEEG